MVDRFVKSGSAEPDPRAGLTTCQREILQLVAEVKSLKEITVLLDISVKTVESHRAQIVERLRVHDLTGLVRLAIRVGLVSPESRRQGRPSARSATPPGLPRSSR